MNVAQTINGELFSAGVRDAGNGHLYESRYQGESRADSGQHLRHSSTMKNMNPKEQNPTRGQRDFPRYPDSAAWWATTASAAATVPASCI
ncbi:hypothetical protein [Nocardia goodfellowii]|uniref:Uncharacterized protein n=1 Tax=Nocardia goodfellowii TaxID=882446 RepID=A0ABS4QBJ2_9NOCA|nr:hypothetical protein [Nocardia goodfellowii]MBP2188468.1 hypothetical protein [Nocardia goodfellowii]